MSCSYPSDAIFSSLLITHERHRNCGFTFAKIPHLGSLVLILGNCKF